MKTSVMHPKLIPTKNIWGTHFIGRVYTTYDDLVEIFGPPHVTFGDKTTAEWGFDADGTVFTIYDWKQPETPKEVHGWHVGGRSENALRKAVFYLGDKARRTSTRF